MAFEDTTSSRLLIFIIWGAWIIFWAAYRKIVYRCWVFGALCVLVVLWEEWLLQRLFIEVDMKFYFGVAATIIGLIVTIIARHQLGENWNGTAKPNTSNRLVRGGCYGVVRHPIYAGFLVATLGSIFIIGGLVGVLLFAAMFFTLLMKISMEEHHLLKMHGAEYEAYIKKVTDKLFPKIL